MKGLSLGERKAWKTLDRGIHYYPVQNWFKWLLPAERLRWAVWQEEEESRQEYDESAPSSHMIQRRLLKGTSNIFLAMPMAVAVAVAMQRRQEVGELAIHTRIKRWERIIPAFVHRCQFLCVWPMWVEVEVLQCFDIPAHYCWKQEYTKSGPRPFKYFYMVMWLLGKIYGNDDGNDTLYIKKTSELNDEI